jgi:cytochrome c oxidase cbb3-type subunit III
MMIDLSDHKGSIPQGRRTRFRRRERVEFSLALRRLICAASILAVALGASSGFPQNPQAPSPEIVERGRQQFQQSCAFCHGPDATGGRGPDLIRSKLVADDAKGNLIGQVIRSGRPDKGMPPLPLNDDQIQAIAAFLHARLQESLDSARLPKSYAVAKLLTGNREAGEAYFNGTGGCKSCHSPSGDLKGVANKYSPLELEARMLYPEKAPSSTVTVTTASGEQVKGSLAHLDEFSVALRDSSGWYRSYPRDQVKVDVHDPLAAHRALLNTISDADVHNLFAYLETLK